MTARSTSIGRLDLSGIEDYLIEAHQENRTAVLDGLVAVTVKAVKKLLDAAFLHGEDRFSRGFAFIWLGSLFVLGAVLWRYFLNGGVIQLNLHDWLEAAKRYAFLQDAVLGGELPLHTPGTSELRAVTDRFITVVDTNRSPQILLLGFLQIGPFILTNTLLLYSAGFYGMLKLRRRFHLSPVAFSSMFFLGLL